jgi:hypothetical protein
MKYIVQMGSCAMIVYQVSEVNGIYTDTQQGDFIK